jgi:hypothetical protein
MTAANALTVVVAVASMLPSATLAQDARVGEDRWENDTANVVEPNGADSMQPRIVWRTPEVRLRTWEEQREYGRSSQRTWMFRATETGEQ